MGTGNFKKTGHEFLKYFVTLGGLKPFDRVLDVGCGIGRMAVPLTEYLNHHGSYEGFDIVPEGINWCTRKLTTNYPNFNFQLADISNKRYNPDGVNKASTYRFPYPSGSFDFVFLTSVFTHMMPDDMENYLAEISRVLKQEGACLITFFLLNKESENNIREKKSRLNFENNYGNYSVENEETPENAVSYNEGYVRNLFGKYKLNIVEPINYGSWCGRTRYLSFQDIVVGRKKIS